MNKEMWNELKEYIESKINIYDGCYDRIFVHYSKSSYQDILRKMDILEIDKSLKEAGYF